MRKVPSETYDRIDNRVYDAEGDSWWQPDSSFYQLKVAFNPVRVGYVRRKLLDELHTLWLVPSPPCASGPGEDARTRRSARN